MQIIRDLTSRPARTGRLLGGALLLAALLLTAPGHGPGTPPEARAQVLPQSDMPPRPALLLDGVVDDLFERADVLVVDEAGEVDAAGMHPETDNGRDLVGLAAVAEYSRLWIGLRFAGEENADTEPGLLLLVDGDDDASTGTPMGGLGCELVWDIGDRNAVVSPENVQLEDTRTMRALYELGIRVQPTITSDQLEIVLPYRMPDGRNFFEGPRARIALLDTVSGDRLPVEGGVELTWGERDLAVQSIPLDRGRPGDLRIANFNIEHEGLLKVDDTRRQAAIGRLLRAVDADVWVINEVWDGSPEAIRDRLATLVGDAPDAWHAMKEDSGNVLVSRLPILQKGEVIEVESENPRDRHRVSYALLLDDEIGQVMVIANHWRCCGADDKRQIEADGVVSFFRDLRTRGGRIDVPEDLPVVLVGDFNLVGLAQPRRTVLTGDVQDEARFGEDFPPDWDGSPLEALVLRHPDAPYTSTWRSSGQPYYPGRLDYVMLTDSAVEVARHYALFTETLDEQTLRQHDLRRDDSTVASDHAVLVVDLRRP